MTWGDRKSRLKGRVFSTLYLSCSASAIFAVAPVAIGPGWSEAYAVEAPGQTADADAAGVETVVVTARRRTESLQNVPISIDVFSGQQLEDRHVTSVKDLVPYIPGIQYSDRGVSQTEITIRGVGGDARNPGLDSGVGVYIDGVYVPRTSGFNADLADIKRIEVLRGPQGTLFGKNTIGGVINIITEKPRDRTGGSVLVSYGNYNALRTQATLETPVASNLFAKATVSTSNAEGYLHNTYDGRDYNNQAHRAVRTQMRWLANDDLEVNVSLDGAIDSPRQVNNQVASPAGAAAAYYTGDPTRINANAVNSEHRDIWGGSVTADYTLPGDFVLTSISGARQIAIRQFSDIDMTPRELFHSGPFTDTSKMFSQEVRLVSPTQAAFRYVGGLYYFFSQNFGARDIWINNAHVYDRARVQTQSYAGYVNADYDLTQALTATGGVRFTDELKHGSFLQTYQGNAALAYAFPGMQREDTNTSWTAGLSYKVTPDLTGYGNVSRGFKSGGFNYDTLTAAGLTARNLTFKPETVTSYEIGVKGQVPEVAATYRAALFTLDYNNKQVSQFVQVAGAAAPTSIVSNAGRARSQGFELETSIKPLPPLTLSGSVTYTNAVYRNFPAGAYANGAYVSYSGNHVERTPEFTASLGAEYRHPIDPGVIVAGITSTYVGEHYLQADNLSRNFEPGYVLLEARLGFESEQGWAVSVWGKNLLEETYRIYGRVFAGLDQAVYGEPMTLGADFRYKF